MANLENRKTVREWLEEFPEPIRSQAKVNLEEANRENPLRADWETSSLFEAMSVAFVWSESREGGAYWAGVMKEYEH